MIEKKVPGEQMKYIDKLVGNNTFASVRGRFRSINDLGIFGDILEQAKSPTDFCNNWDQLSADMRVIGNILACCKRDGFNEAAEEIKKALVDPTFMLPGETVPFDKTEPFTVVVFDFEKTLTMIRWIRCAHWDSLDIYLDEYYGTLDKESLQNWISRTDYKVTHELFKVFPTLLSHACVRRKRKDHVGWDLLSSYRDYVLDDFDIMQFFKISAYLTMAKDTFNPYLEIFYNDAFGFLVREDQARVLSRFSRKQQKRISTWTVRLPVMLVDPFVTNQKGLFVGFHPEDNHGDFECNANAYPSQGCSNKYGVVAMDQQYNDPLFNHARCCHEDVYSFAGPSRAVLLNSDEKIAFELDAQFS
jgi:hypothetical protein